MLNLDKPLDIDGIAVFRDHSDPNLFWYLPGPIRLARHQDNNRASFSFIKYKPAVAGIGVKGGGFAMFETTLALDPNKEQTIKARVLTEPGVTQPRLSPVMFEEGTVQCIALNIQGAGGTEAVNPPPGAFNAVEKILGATSPSMDAQNRAAFSLTLSQEGASILEQALEQGLAPIGVLYSFVYTGMRPALEVEITADMEMIFNHFSANLEAQYQWVRAGIDAAFESLKQSGAISIKILNFTGEADEAEQEKWALEFFKDELLAKWFTPSFTPGQLVSPQAQADPLTEVAKFNREILGSGNSSNSEAKPEAKPDPKINDGTKNDPETKSETKTEGNAGSQAGNQMQQTQPQPVRQSAVFTPVSMTPTPLPDGQSVSHVPSATGTQETVTVTGTGATVKVDDIIMALDQKGQFKIDIPPEKSVQIEVTWPAASRQETFHLFFDYDKPSSDKWSVSPPSDSYRAYVTNSITDQRFQAASGVADGDGASWNGSERGADRLTKWLSTLAKPKQVETDAYASFEQSPQQGNNNTIRTGQDQADYNMRLSIRRRDVAEGIIGSSSGVTLSRTSGVHGDKEARSTPNNPATGDPNNRVVKIKGNMENGQSSTFKGTLSRPKSITPNTPSGPPQTPTPTPATPQTPTPKPTTEPTSNTMPGVLSLKMKYIRQEERKKMTFYYNRAEAARRLYAPQGFFGLLLGDLADKSGYFTEVDLDDPFFREFEIQAEAPIDFDRIGLSSAQVALDYGDPKNPNNHKHSDFMFHEYDKGPKDFTVFLNSTYDVDYLQQQQFHFNPDSGWDSDKFSIELPAARTANRALFINPYDVLDFLEITVVPGDIDAGIVTSTEVTLHTVGPAEFDMKRVLTVLPDSPPQIWKLRAPKPTVPEIRTVTYALKHRLKDGTVREQLPVELSSSTLLVHDPFNNALNIEFIPLFDAATIRQVFIDVEYNDPTNRYRRSERLEIRGDQVESVKLRIALLDPEHREFSYRFTVVEDNDDFRRLAFQTSNEELIPIQL